MVKSQKQILSIEMQKMLEQINKRKKWNAKKDRIFKYVKCQW